MGVNHSRQVFLLLATAAFLSVPVHATTVSVIRTPQHIVVAADSLFIYEGIGSKYECKIIKQGNMYFAIAGLRDDKKSGFFADGLAIRAAEYSTTLHEAAVRFAASGADPFGKALERIRRNAPTYYAEKIKTRPEPLQIVFFAMEHGAPTYELVYFTVTDKPRRRVAVTPHRIDCPGDGCPNGNGVRILGENQAAEKASNREAAFWRGVSDEEAARKIVRIEEIDSPTDVGGGIDVLTLDKTGAHWTQPQHECK